MHMDNPDIRPRYPLPNRYTTDLSRAGTDEKRPLVRPLPELGDGSLDGM